MTTHDHKPKKANRSHRLLMGSVLFAISLFAAPNIYAQELPGGSLNTEIGKMHNSVMSIQAIISAWGQAPVGDIEAAKTGVIALSGEIARFLGAYRVATTDSPLARMQSQVTKKMADQAMTDFKAVFSNNAASIAGMCTTASIGVFARQAGKDLAEAISSVKETAASLVE